MKLYKRFTVMFLLLSLAGTAFAQITAEWIPDSGSKPPGISALEDAITNELKDFDPAPKKFMKGFADASVFASHGATQRAYGDYKKFAITAGAMVGARLPSSIGSIVNDIKDFGDKLEKENGDMALGVNAQAALQFGLNSSFLVDGLYLGLRLGYVNITSYDDISIKIFHIGPVAHYRLLKGIDIGVFKWRGITVGSGFLYQNTTLNASYLLDDAVSAGVFVANNPKLTFDMDITTYTIPLELNTSIQLLWFLNLDAGVGMDVAFGSNTTTMGIKSDVYASGTRLPGKLSIKGGGSEAPTIINPKVMANLGFKFGPVILDVPVTYYISDNMGLNVGVTLGFVL